jgi:hypothetical protein
MKQARGIRWAIAVAALAAASGLLTSGLAGCGTPGTPQPPSLNLPSPVSDLSATRTGDAVKLTWTMPAKNTDKLKLKENVPVHICRREGAGACVQAGADLTLPPGADGVFTETLPPALATGSPRPLAYFVELKNKKGRSAGLSNGAVILAGQAPAAVAGLTAEVRKQGVVLHWAANAEPGESGTPTVIRLHRKLVSAPQPKPQGQAGLLAPEPEPVERSLVVQAPDEIPRAIDNDIRLGQVYEYRAQRVLRVAITLPANPGQPNPGQPQPGQPQAGQTQGASAQAEASSQAQVLELAGPLSNPIRVDAADIFPPDVPTGLAAIATQSGTENSIDLSWKANTDTDLAGYAVYRREGDGPWQRISPAEPVIGPAFHDAHVRPGQTYRYAVTALDQTGHESGRSVEAEETAPQP